MRSDLDRLQDILDAADRIEKYASEGKRAFDTQELIQSWMIQNIQIIGESAARLSDVLIIAHPEIPWSKIIAMRNILVHAYFDIDPEEVWPVVINDIPYLKEKISRIIDDLS